MSAFLNYPAGANLSRLTTDQEFDLLTRATGSDGVTAIYVQANGAIGQYDAVGIDENGQAAKLTTAIANSGWMIGFAQSAFADNEYGWVAHSGTDIKVNVLANCGADVGLFTSATAGSLDDGPTGTTFIRGVTPVTAVGGTAGSVQVISLNPYAAADGDHTVLDGVTAGTVTPSKALVVDSDGRVDALVIGALNIGTGAGHPMTRSDLADNTKIKVIPLNSAHKVAAWKASDPLPDTPDATSLGLGDTAGSVLVGSTTNGGATATSSENAGFTITMPEDYVSGSAFSIIGTAKVTAARQVSASIDFTAKAVTEAGLGADLVTTTATSVNTGTAFADKTFDVNGTGLVAGSVIEVVTVLATNDTGAANDGHAELGKLVISYTGK